jgi:hypothetical protein
MFTIYNLFFVLLPPALQRPGADGPGGAVFRG